MRVQLAGVEKHFGAQKIPEPGRSTLLGMLLGTVPLTAGKRSVGRRTSSARSRRNVT